MNKFSFKLAYRNFNKNRSYSFINLFGLLLGITSCLLITLHLLQEFSYDRFHPQHQNMYRVVMNMYNGNEFKIASAPVYPAVGPNLVYDMPEVTEYMRILPFGSGVYLYETPSGELVRFNESRAVLADKNFFSMTGFKLLKGDPEKVLSDKNLLVLSESTARRYFGDEDPMGKTITYRGESQLVVSGIMEDFPENSHMQFDIITSLMSWNGFESWEENWGWYDFYTFIRISPNVNIDELSGKMTNYLDEKKAEYYENSGTREQLWMQPVSSIHLQSKGLGWDMGINGNANQAYFLGVIALIIMIIAWVNFINLTTARAAKRAKEVGIRKVVGASRVHLLGQFLTETFLYNLASVLISIVLVILLIPVINQWLVVNLNTQWLQSSEFIILVTSLTLIGTIISGIYPAFLLTRYKAISSLKGNVYSRNTNFGFRKVLVVLQFTVSSILIIFTFVVVNQLNFMQTQDLGIAVDQTLVLRGPTNSRGEGDLANRMGVFENSVKDLSAVKGFAKSSIVPGIENFGISDYYSKFTRGASHGLWRTQVDAEFLPAYEVPVLYGRNFYPDTNADSSSVILNEQAVKLMGFENASDAVGEYLNPDRERPWQIVGVVGNYHHSSLKKALEPIIFFHSPNVGSYFSIKIAESDINSSISQIEGLWDKIYPDNPFDFFFLDSKFNEQYQSDEQFNTAFAGFSVLAIIIACLGLFGLVSFTAEQAKKQIGIRKVFGAPVISLFIMLIRDYALLILIALVISVPLGYWLISEWLQEFPYRTEIGAGVFVLSAIMLIVIAFVTVSYQSLSAAYTNPTDVLRDE